jgi:acetyl esterase/lipase
LRTDGLRLPTALGLFSPWLDMAVDPDDPELAIAGLRQAGLW